MELIAGRCFCPQFPRAETWLTVYRSFAVRLQLVASWISNVFRSIYRRFRGVSPACPPPVTGRSASFRLRFRFVRVVRAVRAGEAKLRGRLVSDVLNAGLPG